MKPFIKGDTIVPRAKFAHQRFEEHIEKVGKCWLWKGCQKDGYGYFTTGSRRDGTRTKQAAHIFAHRFYNGPVQAGQVVYRTCRTLTCVNPDHLRVGSRADMVAQAVRKGTWTQGDASHFPDTSGERNGRSKLADSDRKAIIVEKGKTKVIVLARRFNVTEQTIYAVQKKWPI